MTLLSSDILVLDCESSGCSEESYPITIGVCGPQNQGWHWMIAPMEDWDYWDSFAEAIHGIEHSTLVEDGRDSFLVAREMNAIFKGMTLVVDSEWDKFWVQRLFEDSGVVMAFHIALTSDLLTPAQSDEYANWVENTEMTHHAMQDAAQIRQRLLAFVS